jgi:hypothetical protein
MPNEPRDLREDAVPSPGLLDLDDGAKLEDGEDEDEDEDYADEPEGNEMRGARPAPASQDHPLT